VKTIQQQSDGTPLLRQSVDNDRPSPVTVVASPKASLNCRRAWAHVDLFLRASCSWPGRKR